jgi:hypothetical protein
VFRGQVLTDDSAAMRRPLDYADSRGGYTC